jgi:hypothetical protein
LAVSAQLLFRLKPIVNVVTVLSPTFTEDFMRAVCDLLLVGHITSDSVRRSRALVSLFASYVLLLVLLVGEGPWFGHRFNSSHC